MHELVVIFNYFVSSFSKTKAGFIKIITQVIHQDVDLNSSGNIELFSQLIPFDGELINNSAVIARKDLTGKEEVKVSMYLKYPLLKRKPNHYYTTYL